MAVTPRKKYSSDRRQRMKELQAEGKMTPEHGRLGGRPAKQHSESQKTKRASTVVTEMAREHSDLIASVIPAVLHDPDASDHLKLRAIKLGLQIETNEHERTREEDERAGRFRSLRDELPEDRDALVAALAEKVASNPVLAAELGAILTASAERAGLPSKTD